MKKLVGMAVAVALATAARAAITIGSTDDPKADEIDFGNDTYCLVFSNGNAEAWTFTPSAPLRVEKLLVVGGGGSGGCDCGAGGGGGAVLYTNYTTLAAAERPVISGEIAFTVGAGAYPADSASRSGKVGSASEITVGGVTFTAYGGGGGGHWSGAGSLAPETGKIASGGGKGNQAFANYRTDGMGYNSLYGHWGGCNNGSECAGGGGGAGGVGEDATSTTGGKGGIGVTNDITGVAHLYGSGGCAGRNNPQDAWEGGGSRKSGSYKGVDGLGGGGAGSYSSGNNSGAGGCGTVILVVTLLNDGKITATMNDAFAACDGNAHACSVTVYTKNVTVKWGTAEEGPFDLDAAPGFTEIGIHSCWCQLTATERETRILEGTVYIRGDVEPLDIGVTADPGAHQYSFGNGLYTIGFTNVSAGTVDVTPINFLRIERMIVVGGGGSGGNNCGGGGGGGGVVYADYLALSENQRPVITNAFSVCVGAGAPSQPTAGAGIQGSASMLQVEGVATYAYGGGGGGAYTAVPRAATAENEIGSGGGSCYGGVGQLGVNGWGYNSAQGNKGGLGNGDLGGGGGGAGETGGAASSTAGCGGAGLSCSITGETHLYGSGGGGGNGSSFPTPPEGGGRGGGTCTGGVNGLGGGGGGSKGGTGDWASGAGGSGCIYLLVKVIEGTTVSATLSDYYGSTAGEAHSNELRIATADVTARWSETSADGPFDLAVQPSYSTPGVHTNWCRLTATGKDPKVLRGIVYLRSASGDYFVTTDGSDLTGLGTTDRPYASVAKAASEVRLGNTVRVAAGTYVETGVVLDKAIAVVGDAADRASVTVSGGKLNCVFTITHEDARVAGLTIANGYNVSGGGNVHMTAGVVTNCVLTGGLGTGSHNGGNAYIGGGLMIDCEIKSGSARRGGGATLAGSGRMVRCYVHGNSASDSGGGLSINGNAVVENSLVTGNSATYGGGVQLDSSGAWLVNCTVAGNSGNYSGIWHETGGGHVVNCVVYNGYYSKKGTTEHCALSSTPEQGGTATFAHNVTLTADMFAETATYRPVVRTALHDGGDNAAYKAHAVSASDYGAGPRRQGRIDIGHYELPMRIGTLFSVR